MPQFLRPFNRRVRHNNPIFSKPVVIVVSDTATISGTGSLVSDSLVLVIDSGNFSGTGSLTSASLVEVIGAASISGSGTVSASSLVEVISSVSSISGSGSVASTSLVEVISSTSSLSGSGSVSADGDTVPVGADLTGIGTITADGEVIHLAVTGGGARHYRHPPFRFPFRLRPGQGQEFKPARIVKSDKAKLSSRGILVGLDSRVIVHSDDGLLIGFTFVEADSVRVVLASNAKSLKPRILHVIVGSKALLVADRIHLEASGTVIKVSDNAYLIAKSEDLLVMSR